MLPRMTEPRPPAAVRRTPRPLRAAPPLSVLLPLAVAVLAAGLVLAREATWGAGLSWDSINSIVVARNLLAGEGLRQVSGGYFATWPPLYPLLLAAASLNPLDPYDAAGPLNAAIFGLTAFVAARWLLRRLESRFLALWGCLAVALAPPLAGVASEVRSEPAFILFVVAALDRTDAWLEDGRRPSLLWAAAFASLACMTRYAGLSLVAAVLLLMLLRRGPDPRERLRDGAAFALVSLLPIGLWMLRNLALVGRPTGRRLDGVRYSPGEIADGIAATLGEWVYLDLPLDGLRVLAVLPLAALAVGVARAAARRRRGGARDGAACVFGGFALVYLAALFAALAAVPNWSGVSPRFLAPAYVPLLFAGLLAADRVLARAREDGAPLAASPRALRALAGRGGSGRLALGLAAALSLWLAFEASAVWRETQRANAAPFSGYTAAARENPEVLRYVRDHPPAAPVLSNARYAVHLHGRAPGLTLAASEDAMRAQLADAADGVRVVWLHGRWWSLWQDYGAALLRALPGLEPVAELSDGAVFRVNAAWDAAAAYRAAWEAAASGEPVVRAAFDVHLDGRTLAWLRDPCRPEDTEAAFVLHVVPADPADLPADRRGSGFDNLGFDFDRRGAVSGGTCMARAELPAYAIDRVRVGQWASAGGRQLWGAEFRLSEPPRRQPRRPRPPRPSA